MNRKKVGDKLFLSLNVGEDLSGGFVSAFLYDQNDNSLGQHNLDYVADGLFSESNAIMPSVQKLIVVYKVFSDAARTQVDDEFPFVSECFEQDVVLDAIENFQPKGQVVQGRVRNDVKIKQKVSMNKIIKGHVRIQPTIKATVREARIVGKVRLKTIIKGVVYDL